MRSDLPSVVDFTALQERFATMAADYQSAEPFPHMSVNGLFDEQVLRAVAAEFPDPQAMAGKFSGEIQGGKFAESDYSTFGPITQQFVAACNSGPFMHALAAITGIEGLISDPYLSGGGQHQTGRGGRLKVRTSQRERVCSGTGDPLALARQGRAQPGLGRGTSREMSPSRGGCTSDVVGVMSPASRPNSWATATPNSYFVRASGEVRWTRPVASSAQRSQRACASTCT